MTLPEDVAQTEMTEDMVPGIRLGGLKVVLYIIVLALSLSVVDLIFSWTSVEAIPPALQNLSGLILLVNPYVKYIQAILIFILGYLVINAVGGMAYTYIRRLTDHPTAATVRTMTRIAGIAVLLSLMTSVFDVNPAAALTVGSFGGLVVGFATQTILSHVVSGIFLLLSRPYTFGDVITVAGQTGMVKEIRLMHLLLESTDGTREILIPSGTFITQIIQKMKPPMQIKPIKTSLVLEKPPTSAQLGSSLTLTGRLLEANTNKPIAKAKIKILDRDIGGDDLLASGITDEGGNFVVAWTARKTDPFDNTVEVYAKFEGNEDYEKSESKTFVIEVK